MKDRQPPELFAERPIRSDFGQRDNTIFKRIATVGVVILLVIGGVTMCALHFLHSSAQPTEIPTIKAEAPVKQRPEQPGGIDIPHQNVMVFQQLDNGNDAKPGDTIEHLLPQPEVPQPGNAPKAEIPVTIDSTAANIGAPNIDGTPGGEDLIQSAGTIPTTVSTPVTPTPVPQAVPAPVATVATAPLRAPAPAVTPAPVSAPMPVPAPAVIAAPVKEVQTTVAMAIKPIAPPSSASHLPESMFTSKTTAPPAGNGGGSGTSIQLASIQGQQAAQNYLADATNKYSNTLHGVKLRLVRADLGSKGVYYRVQSESVSEAQGKALCSALKSRQTACILVRP